MSAFSRTTGYRLELLRTLGILDSPREPAFDALVRAASLACRCPISLITLVDADRHWFKASVGVDDSEVANDHGLCLHAITRHELVEVADLRVDVRFAGSVLVTGPLQSRFYAGQPIVFQGVALGTICVVDRVPRTLDADQRRLLEELAAAAAALLDGRMAALLHAREAGRLLDFADLGGEWIWESDADHCCTWMSGSQRHAAGLFRGAVLGQRFDDVPVFDGTDGADSGNDGNDGDRGKGAARLLDLLDGHAVLRDVVVRTGASANGRFLSLNAVPITDGDGAFAGYRGSVRDVTDHVSAQRDANARDRLLSKVASQVPGMIFSYQSDDVRGVSCFPYASEGIRDIYEVAPEDVIESSLAAFARLHPDDVAAVQDSVRVSKETGCIWYTRFRVILPRRGLRWLQGAATPEKQRDGSTLWHGYIADVTESHVRDRELAAAYESLQVVEQRLRAVTDNLPLPIAHFDRDQNYTFANIHARRALDASGSVLGRSLREVRGDALHAELRPTLDAVMTGVPVAFEGPVLVDGEVRHHQSMFVPDFDEQGTVVGFYAMTLDLTERRHAELKQVASEHLLRIITDHLPALVSYIGVDQRYRFANEAYRTWLGVDHLAMIGRRVDEVIDPEVWRMALPHFEQACAGLPATFEQVVTGRHGKVAFQVQYLPDIDATGAVTGVFAMTTDITARRESEQRVTASEKRLLDLTNNMPASIVQFDLEERCVFANDMALQVERIDRAELPLLTFGSHISRELYELHRPAITQVKRGERATVHGERDFGSRHMWFTTHLIPEFGDDGAQCGFYGMTFDITSLKIAEQERRRSDQRLRKITDNLPVLISYIDEERRLTYANETFRTWVGAAAGDVVGHRMEEVIGAELYAQRADHVGTCLAGEVVNFQLVSKDAAGVDHHLQTTYLPDIQVDGRVIGVISLSVDVTVLKHAEERLTKLAHRDTLTGLANRRSFDTRLAETLALRHLQERAMAVMFLDVDHFKAVNDTHGHVVGDAVLKTFAIRIEAAVRNTDFVARLAGDEFVVILHDLHDLEEARHVARKIVEHVDRPFHVAGIELSVTTSVGVALVDRSHGDASAVLARADEALYQAKLAGRNTYRLAA